MDIGEEILYMSILFFAILLEKELERFMKIERLIGIITTLQQKEKVTAPYLAEKFEVSRRTINRDIEDICRAGIPIVTTQGKNGGISLMEGYACGYFRKIFITRHRGVVFVVV